MRTDIERLLLWFVPISLLSFLAGSAAFAIQEPETKRMVASALGMSPVQFSVNVKLLQSLIYGAGSLVGGVWLAFQPHSSLGRRVLWLLFGLTTGMWAVAIWLLVNICDRDLSLTANNSFKPNPLRSFKIPSDFSGGSA
jgi:hypothetical protein